MTTEVLRNMIYARSPALEGLRYVVLDEVHYLQDPYRGAVWEEVIIHLPPDVRSRVPVGDGLERRGVRGVDRDGARRDRGDHRGAATGASCEHLYMVGERGSDQVHLLPDVRRAGR